MCRLLAYKGDPILLDKLLYEPKNSLIHQSFDASEIEEPLNGDGFGVAWYIPEIDPEPSVFVSVSPAWSNRNLRYLSRKIKSGCMFAHVRAASFGDTAEANCHPFHFKNFVMMHNGSIEGFAAIKRALRHRLSDEIYAWIRGQTDSEHLFALFLEQVAAVGPDYTLKDIADALQSTVDMVLELQANAGIARSDGLYLNCVVTDGKRMVATRLVTTDEVPLSLHYSTGSRYECAEGVCHMIKAEPGEHAVLIVSEQLTTQNNDWKTVPANHMMMVDEDCSVSFRSFVVPPYPVSLTAAAAVGGTP